MEALRIYVGGLGERVTKDDVINTFSNMGFVQNIDFIKTKNRSFAYINFLPSSEKSLAKLFSMYNGCMWKGGKLKLEKAKEHYTDRMKREWEADAKALNNPPYSNDVANEDMVASPKQKIIFDEKAQIQIFFPRLGKMKSLPLRGTGKHKYSFQRVEARQRPLHFCDCPEHSVTVEPQEKIIHNLTTNRLIDRNSRTGFKNLRFPVQEQLQDSKIQDEGMNEEEISIMNSVMNKILDRETLKTEQKGSQDLTRVTSKIVPKGVQDLPQQSAHTSDFPVDLNEIEDESDDDDDDIMINVFSAKNNGSISESLELQTSLANKMRRSNEQSKYGDSTTQSNDQSHEKKDKLATGKRKSLASENDEQKRTSPLSKKKACLLSDKSENHIENSKIVAEAETKASPTKKKKTWKELIGDGLTNSFNLNHITPSHSKTSSNSKEHIGVENAVYEENPDGQSSESSENDEIFASELDESSDETSSDSEGHIGVENGMNEVNHDRQSSENGENNETFASELDGSSDEASSDSEEHIGIENAVNEENYDNQSSENSENEEISPSELDESNDIISYDSEGHIGVENAVNEENPDNHSSKPRTEPDKSIKGTTWMQKSSWTELIGGGSGSSFTFSKILPETTREKHTLPNQNALSTINDNSNGAKMKEPRTTNPSFGGFRGASKGFGMNKATTNASTSNAIISTKSDSKPKQKMSSSDIVAFMRSDESLKDWMSAKTTLSAALKKKNNKA